MGLFAKLAGTVSTVLQIGGPSGPGVNNNAGSLEATTPNTSVYTDFRAAMLEYQQSLPAATSITVPTGNTVIIAQDFTNNGHVAFQGTSRMVWVY